VRTFSCLVVYDTSLRTWRNGIKIGAMPKPQAKRKPKEMVLVHSTMTGAQTLRSLSAPVEKLSQLVAGLHATDSPPSAPAPVSPGLLLHIRRTAHYLAAYRQLKGEVEEVIARAERAAADWDVLYVFHQMGVETGVWRYIREQLPGHLRQLEQQIEGEKKPGA